MIGKGFKRLKSVAETEEAKGFDAFDMRLGDLMRGERATLGKSLLDVQRELRIKAAYIAAIENCDPSAFDTPGFIAGYVRSYARYLNMDPDWAFATFCQESGFATAHGMSVEASALKSNRDVSAAHLGKDIFAASATPYLPAGEAVFSKVEPAAIGSIAVLVALIGGLGYGGWSVLQEVQRVQFAPVEQTPTVVSDVDPLAGGRTIVTEEVEVADLNVPSPEALDRLYRPAPLDVPVLVARDTPISTISPGELGTLDPITGIDAALAEAVANNDFGIRRITPPLVQVSEDPIPEVALVAVRPAWVRVRAADGVVIFEGIMNKGDTFELPSTEEAATLRVGESGGIYFAVNGTHYGPAGTSGTVTSNLALSVDNLTAAYKVADITGDTDLAEVVNVAEVNISQ